MVRAFLGTTEFTIYANQGKAGRISGENTLKESEHAL